MAVTLGSDGGMSSKTEKVCNDVIQSYVPFELNTTGSFSPQCQSKSTSVCTVRLSSIPALDMFRTVADLSKLLYLSVAGQNQKLGKGDDIDFDIRIVPILGCILTKSAAVSELVAAIDVVQTKLMAPTSMTEQRRLAIMGEDYERDHKRILKRISTKMEAMSKLKGHWEWTIQLGESYGALGIGEGRGELAPKISLREMLNDPDDEDEDEDTTIGGDTLDFDNQTFDNSTIVTGDDPHLNIDDDSDDDSEEEGGGNEEGEGDQDGVRGEEGEEEGGGEEGEEGEDEEEDLGIIDMADYSLGGSDSDNSDEDDFNLKEELMAEDLAGGGSPTKSIGKYIHLYS